MKWWSDVDGTWVEGTVLNVTGPKATHTLVDGAGYMQRENPLVRAGINQGELVTARELKGKSNAPSWKESNRAALEERQASRILHRCACGRVRPANRERCGSCRAAKRNMRGVYQRKETAA
jgi:hypothetical protein